MESSGLTDDQLDNIQGDIWSKGFLKKYEIYYFFAIKPEKEKDFVQNLGDLVSGSEMLISTLRKVKKEREKISARKENGDHSIVPVSNALIAFTSQGLSAIQAGITGKNLDLESIEKTDPAFHKGMASPDIVRDLRDPKPENWEAPFKSGTTIHGMLKVAGCSKDEAEKHLIKIKKVLTSIDEAVPDFSRLDGWARPNAHGKEHFGFRDHISQPLIIGIDELEERDPPNMNTNPSIIIVTSKTKHEGSGGGRPSWMHDGSFIVFRKLEQDVEGFETLTDRYSEYDCKNKAQMGAKLMGRWANGAPIVKYPNDPDSEVTNDFDYFKDTKRVCPMSAHIRKTNPRRMPGEGGSERRAPFTKIIRCGIPYGTDYKGPEDTSTRGMLFACYQGNIENAFKQMQESWCNSEKFPTETAGNDPIVGQTKDGTLKTEITTHEGHPKILEFQQLVTLKGGEFFFVPSIKALREVLGGKSS